jgi:uncharacterized Zn finger protein (UPF0148 family)
MIPEICPFCKQPATFALIASNDYELTCPTCEIKVEITQVAAAMECSHPEIVLQYIREQQVETKKPLTSDDMLRGEPKVEAGAGDVKE